MTTVVYDGGCGFCNRFRQVIEALDWLDRFEWTDLYQADYDELPVLEEECVAAMQVIDHGTVHSGFYATRRILRSIPALAPLAAVMYVPGVPFLGQRVYRWIAAHRHCRV